MSTMYMSWITGDCQFRQFPLADDAIREQDLTRCKLRGLNPCKAAYVAKSIDSVTQAVTHTTN